MDKMDKCEWFMAGILVGFFLCAFLMTLFEKEKRLNLRLDGYCQAWGYQEARELDKKNKRVKCVSSNGFSWNRYQINNK